MERHTGVGSRQQRGEGPVRRSVGIAVGILGLVVLTSACRQYMPTNRYLQPRQRSQASLSTADARRRFDHGRHARALATAVVTCADCHRFDAKIDTGNDELAATLSRTLLQPGAAACHYCHGPSETRIATAPTACTTCHDNLVPLTPANHQIAWLRVHATTATANPVECQNCHRDSFCINCHQARDTILTWFHDTNYLSYHSIEARANPMQCGNCHREDFCTNCHQKAQAR
jgi:hypothetical protein